MNTFEYTRLNKNIIDYKCEIINITNKIEDLYEALKLENEKLDFYYDKLNNARDRLQNGD